MYFPQIKKKCKTPKIINLLSLILYLNNNNKILRINHRSSVDNATMINGCHLRFVSLSFAACRLLILYSGTELPNDLRLLNNVRIIKAFSSYVHSRHNYYNQYTTNCSNHIALWISAKTSNEISQ